MPDWKEKALAKMADIASKNRAFQVYLETCVKCGACTDKCHYFLGTGDPKNMPVARQDLLRSVYQRYFTFAGKYFPKLVGARDLTEEVLEEWYSYYTPITLPVSVATFAPMSAPVVISRWGWVSGTAFRAGSGLGVVDWRDPSCPGVRAVAIFGLRSQGDWRTAPRGQ